MLTEKGKLWSTGYHTAVLDVSYSLNREIQWTMYIRNNNKELKKCFFCRKKSVSTNWFIWKTTFPAWNWYGMNIFLQRNSLCAAPRRNSYYGSINYYCLRFYKGKYRPIGRGLVWPFKHHHAQFRHGWSSY